jgi:2-amino-4-hydroxy-6-hydroxymethyldihydropteridine diphosphokinase
MNLKKTCVACNGRSFVMQECFIGLGSNLGDRLANLADALKRIDEELPETVVAAVSHVVESEPAGGDPAQPAYANAVAMLETNLEADGLLERLQGIEAAMGREPGPRNAPRVIDLDVLLFGDEVWNAPELTVPHPRLAERAFTVGPLLELHPGLRLPDGTHLRMDHATQGRIIGQMGAVPGFEDRTGLEVADGDVAEWVPVIDLALDSGYMEDDLFFLESALAEEGIETMFDPWRPGEVTDPFGMWKPVRLMTHHTKLDRALELAAALVGYDPAIRGRRPDFVPPFEAPLEEEEQDATWEG